MKVFLNPGHCPGVDCGAVNNDYGVTEAAIVREVGDMVADYLCKQVVKSSFCNLTIWLERAQITLMYVHQPTTGQQMFSSVFIAMQRRQARPTEQNALCLVTGVLRTAWPRASSLKLSIL